MTKTFVDASVLVSILAMEDDSIDQAGRLDAAIGPITSAITIWEATVALARLRRLPVDDAKAQLDWALNDRGIEVISIGECEAAGALSAHALYGKRNHAAKLNMGDCFAYACAKTNNATLLYKGDDFTKTDLA